MRSQANRRGSPRRYTWAMSAIDERACGKSECDNFGKPGRNIVGHGWFATKSGRRRRYRCKVCGGTLSTNTGSAYRGLRCSRREFDQVASLRVEGVSISATARVTGHSRTTIVRWLERASTAAARFNHRMLRDFDLIELQADELCTFIGSKRRTLWPPLRRARGDARGRAARADRPERWTPSFGQVFVRAKVESGS